MKEKKNIDRLFQEKFKDFEVQPREEVWTAIAARQNPTKKRVIPLWFKLSGAAALLVLVLLAGNFWIHSGNNPDMPVFVNENKVSDSLTSDDKTLYTAVPETSTKTETDTLNSEKNEPAVSTETNRQAAVTSNDTEEKNTETGNKNSVNKIVSGKFRSSVPVKNSDTNSNAVAESGALEKVDAIQNNTAITDAKTELAAKTETGNSIKKEEIDKELDPNTLQEIANKKKEALASELITEKEKSVSKRWGITPMIAPVYYDSFSGSGIDEQFADNTKSADVNLSYGVQVSYAVTKRLTVRSGVNKVDLGYRTEQIGFTPSIAASYPNNTISSINYNDNSQIIQLGSINKSTLASPNTNPAEFLNNNIETANTSLHQELGYIEIPVEAEYALINKKIGLQLIGGVSSLFLSNNSISLEEEGNLISKLGKSNSLNSTSFSTNIGLGLDYKFTPRIQFKLEPMFKYQLNAYTKTVSDFKPYYLGLYSGISFRF